MKIFTDANIRLGTPSSDLKRLFYYYGVELSNDPRNVDGYLAFNKISKRRCSKKKNVLSLGGFLLKDNGVPRSDINWRAADHIVFNSRFYRRICTNKNIRKKHSVIYTLGGIPCDPDMSLVLEPRRIEGPVQFVAIAKWWKRNFKRQSQIINLFNTCLSKKYPNSILHMLGCPKSTRRKGDVILYHKSFHDKEYISIFKNAHVQLMFSPFDTGPVTLAQSLHYRVPFICSNNCVGKEFIKLLGSCGKSINTDPTIKTISDLKKYKPITNKKFYSRNLDNEMILSKIEQIIDNFEEYTSWQWNDRLNYEEEAGKWFKLFKN